MLKLFSFLKKNKKQEPRFRRQWGADRDMTPLSNLHTTPSTFKIAFSRIAIVLTVLFWLMYVASTIIRQFIEGPKSYAFTMEAVFYLIVMSFLTFSALMYLVARQGAFQRFAKHVRVPRAVLDKHFSKNKPSITVLVPSYDEEPQVIRKTLLSAALQEYPDLRVTLLVDNNPYPTNPDILKRLEATRALGEDIKGLLAAPYKKFNGAFKKFEQNNSRAKFATSAAVRELAENYMWAAGWLNAMAEKEPLEDHVDDFFINQVLKELANDLSLVGQALTLSNQEGATLSYDRVYELYRRLVWIFKAEVTVFERKKYASLSHEANKAMNLNSYIGLMGGHYRKEETPNGDVLVRVLRPQKGDITIPDSEFLLTLDADSILLRDYCLRLVYFLEQPDNSKVAVTQTPYSSFRGAPTRIERLASATTDIQHILHQGMSYYGATFWVGANAIIRKRALEDIVEKEWVGGFEIKRFIQDRTVIEDTESSIDLGIHGWKLINYPERLSYSATPPDFGSLVVQRRRWANGGLLILPKFWEQLRTRKNNNELISRTEVMLRVNYMASIAWANLGLVFLLAYPYDGRLLSPLVILAALPYFVAMATDLKYCGYKYTDIIRIYGFNLILLPVNIAGVLKSLQQAITAKKIPFARTPKVKNRTATAIPYVLSPLLIIGFSVFTLWRNIEGENWGNAAFAGFNAAAATLAVVSYIGLWNMAVDIWLGFINWLFIEEKPKQKKVVAPAAALDWKGVLYHGEENGIVPHGTLSEIVNKNNKSKEGSVFA